MTEFLHHYGRAIAMVGGYFVGIVIFAYAMARFFPETPEDSGDGMDE